VREWERERRRPPRALGFAGALASPSARSGAVARSGVEDDEEGRVKDDGKEGGGRGGAWGGRKRRGRMRKRGKQGGALTRPLTTSKLKFTLDLLTRPLTTSKLKFTLDLHKHNNATTS
jgi:hypothetical protein